MIFKPSDKDRLILFVEKLFERGKSVKVEPIAKTATLSQNSYCWLCFTHVADQTGNSKEDIYQLCLDLFKPIKEIELNGELHHIPVTLSGMNKDQKSNFINNFVIYLRDEGFFIPDHEDQKCKEMYQYYRDRGLI